MAVAKLSKGAVKSIKKKPNPKPPKANASSAAWTTYGEKLKVVNAYNAKCDVEIKRRENIKSMKK